jgi:2-haloalkanoic acid dehalogenase type II
MRLSDFRVLTFDCYGTLIDWETGLFSALQPLLQKSGRRQARDEVLAAFGNHESAQESETPSMVYSNLLAEIHRRLAREWGVATTAHEDEKFGNSVPAWPAFADTVQALRYLKQHYKLVILSNVDRASFAGSNARLEVAFDAVYTAEDIGSYKPDARNFRYLLERLAERGISRGEILHTAQSLFHDHAPANAAGLASAWIDRRHAMEGWGATRPPATNPTYNFRFTSLASMVEAHQQEGRPR